MIKQVILKLLGLESQTEDYLTDDDLPSEDTILKPSYNTNNDVLSEETIREMILNS